MRFFSFLIWFLYFFCFPSSVLLSTLDDSERIFSVSAVCSILPTNALCWRCAFSFVRSFICFCSSRTSVSLSDILDSSVIMLQFSFLRETSWSWSCSTISSFSSFIAQSWFSPKDTFNFAAWSSALILTFSLSTVASFSFSCFIVFSNSYFIWPSGSSSLVSGSL